MDKGEARRIFRKIMPEGMEIDEDTRRVGFRVLVKAKMRPAEYCDTKNLRKQTYATYRSKCLNFLAWQGLKILSELDQKDDHSLRKTMRNCAGLIKIIQDDERPELDGKKSNHAKIKSLKNLPIDWREKIIDQMSKKQQALAMVLAVTGCRPHELTLGIKLTWLEDGRLRVYVRGAKVREKIRGYPDAKAGQPWRRFDLHTYHPVLSLLADSQYGPEQRIEHEIVITETQKKSLCQAVQRAGENFWPRRDNKPTAYSFRHQFAADCKGTQVTWEELAGCLGHAVTETQNTYGRMSQARGRSGIHNLKTAREIKINHERDFSAIRKKGEPDPNESMK